MRVVMLIPRTWQNAGREDLLRVGEPYDLPDVVASALIATGAAEAPSAAEPAPAPRETREDSRREVKPFAVPETKRRVV